MLQFVYEFIHVLELPVNGRKADVSHWIEVPEVHHHEVSDLDGLDLLIGNIEDGLFDVGEDPFFLSSGDRSLLAGFLDTPLDLVFDVRLTTSVALNDLRHGEFDGLKGGEALLTSLALSAATDLTSFLEVSRVENLGVWGGTVWAFHQFALNTRCSNFRA